MTDTDPRARRNFLVVVDDTPECRVALRFACMRAHRTGGGVVLLRVIEPAEGSVRSGGSARSNNRCNPTFSANVQALR